MALGLLGILGLGGVGAGIAGGLGYGFGIRYGFERIFPSFQQGGPQAAIKTAASDIASLLGTEGFDAGSAETDTFLGNVAGESFTDPTGDVSTFVEPEPPGGRGKADIDSLPSTPTDVRKFVVLNLVKMQSGYPSWEFRGRQSVDELRNLVTAFEQRREGKGRSVAGKRLQGAINSIYAAIASF